MIILTWLEVFRGLGFLCRVLRILGFMKSRKLDGLVSVCVCTNGWIWIFYCSARPMEEDTVSQFLTVLMYFSFQTSFSCEWLWGRMLYIVVIVLFSCVMNWSWWFGVYRKRRRRKNSPLVPSLCLRCLWRTTLRFVSCLYPDEDFKIFWILVNFLSTAIASALGKAMLLGLHWQSH